MNKLTVNQKTRRYLHVVEQKERLRRFLSDQIQYDGKADRYIMELMDKYQLEADTLSVELIEEVGKCDETV